MKNKYVIAASSNWHPDMKKNLEKQTGARFIFIEAEEGLSKEKLDTIAPRAIFIPHWSYVIDESVFSNFECIVFHMTDLPFGRGGSPLQNLIARGIYDTKISAIRCTKGLDQGPVYLKAPLSLHGNAQEIYIRTGKIIEQMIVTIIETRPSPKKQQGDPVVFKRRTPAQSSIEPLESLEQVFDYIRMLDAPGYPKAFFETDRFRFEFSRGALEKGCIKADVTIFPKKR